MSDRDDETSVTDHGVHAKPTLHAAEFAVAVRSATHAAQSRLVEDQSLGTTTPKVTAYFIEEIEDEGRDASLALSKPSVRREGS